jgi:hypothetical protein
MRIWPLAEPPFAIIAATIELETLALIRHLEEEPSPAPPPPDQTLELEHH